MCGSKKEQVIADNKAPEKKPLLPGDEGYTGESRDAPAAARLEELPEPARTSYQAPVVPPVCKAASDTAPHADSAAATAPSAYQVKFLTLLRKPDSDKKESEITVSLKGSLEKGKDSTEAKAILSSIKIYVNEHCEKNSQTLNSSIGLEDNNFLHKLSFAIFNRIFSNKTTLQNNVLKFVSLVHDTYLAELTQLNDKNLSPLESMIAFSQSNCVEVVFNSQLPEDFESSAQTALSRSLSSFTKATKLNVTEVLTKQIQIGSIISSKFPKIADKVLTASIKELPYSVEYAKMLLENGANPLIPATGQTYSAWDHVWSKFNSPSDAASKEAAKEILKCALQSPTVKTTVASIQAEFPYLAEELRAGTSIDSIISSHPKIGDKAGYLKLGVYHFLKCVKDFALTLTGDDAGFIVSLELPLLQAIPADSHEHGTVASKFTAGTMRTAGVNLPMPGDAGSVVYDEASDSRSIGTFRTKAPHTALKPLTSLVEAEEVDSPAAPAGAAAGELMLGPSSAFSNYGGHMPGSIKRITTPPPESGGEHTTHADDSALGASGALGALGAHDGAFE